MNARADSDVVMQVPSNTLAGAVVQAEASAARLRQVGPLREAAHRLLEQLAEVGCNNLVPASQAAEPLVTATTLLSDGAVQMGDHLHSTAEKVVLVDAATVTGGATRACASYLRERGVSWVGAIIYDRVRPDLDGLDTDPALDLVAELDIKT